MNIFQNCKSTLDAEPLYLPQQLFLKPIARLDVSICLPHIKEMSRSISNWEAMEKLRIMIKPDEFCILKVSNSSLESIHFEAEIEDKAKINLVISKLDGRFLKLNSFPHPLKIHAVEAKLEFPTQQSWDTFFCSAQNMNEMKPGQRPDTVHLSHLPIKWFIPVANTEKEDAKPSEKLLAKVFEKFGPIHRVDIPICDPYRNMMKCSINEIRTFSFDDEQFFEAYVQFKEYSGFTKTIDALKGKKLLRRSPDCAQTVNFTFDFDRTKHLSDMAVKRRQLMKEKVIAKAKELEKEREKMEEEAKRKMEETRLNEQKEKAEKITRQLQREEKRKESRLHQLQSLEKLNINIKIAKEEAKMVDALRELQSLRLVELLFMGILEKIRSGFLKVVIAEPIGEYETYALTREKTMANEKADRQRQRTDTIKQKQSVLKTIVADSFPAEGSGGRSQISASSSCISRSSSRSSSRSYGLSFSSSKNTESNEQESKLSPRSFRHRRPSQTPSYIPVKPEKAHSHLMDSCYPSAYNNYSMRRGRRRMNRLPDRIFVSGREDYRLVKNCRRYDSNAFVSQYPQEMQKAYYKYFKKFLKDDEKRSSSWSRASSKSRSSSRSRASFKSRSLLRSRSKSRSRSRSSLSSMEKCDRRRRSKSS